MKMLRCFSSSGVSCHRPFWLSSKLKSFISSGVIALIVVNNSPTPAKAQKLNQSSSTSPSHVAPQQGVTPLVTPSCSNNITFNEYPVGTPITTQYSNKGIIFGGDSPFITTDGANPTSPVLSGSPQFQGAIEGSFVDPKDGVTPAVAVNFQLDGGYFDSLNSTVLKLYDSQGNLIGKQTNTALGIFTFTVNNLPVAKWRIESVGDEPGGFAIDNVCFALQTVKQSPRLYPSYLKQGDTLASVPVTDFPELEGSLPADSVQPQSQSQDSVQPQSQSQDSVQPQSQSQVNQDSTTISNNAVTTDATTVDKQSCDGIGDPISQAEIFKMAKDIKPNATDRDIRNAYEGFALDSQILKKYNGAPFPSPERYDKTKNRKQGPLANVVPEAVSTEAVVKSAPFGYGPPQIIPYPQSTFWDAKVIKLGKSISLITGIYQNQGYLDYLSHYSEAAKATVSQNEHPTPNLVYMITAGVGVTSGVLDYVGQTPGPGVPFTPVRFYKMVACQIAKPQPGGKYLPGVNYLQMGRGIVLNADRFPGYPPELLAPLPAGRPSSLKFKP